MHLLRTTQENVQSMPLTVENDVEILGHGGFPSDRRLARVPVNVDWLDLADHQTRDGRRGQVTDVILNHLASLTYTRSTRSLRDTTRSLSKAFHKSTKLSSRGLNKNRTCSL